MKKMVFLLMAFLAIGCSNNNSASETAVTHSATECPADLDGTYETQGEDGQPSETKIVVFKKNKDGIYEFTDGAGSGATTVLVDGNSHTVQYYDDEGSQAQTATYTAKCSNNKLFVDFSAPGITVKRVLSTDEQRNYVANDTVTVDGKPEVSNSKMTRVLIIPEVQKIDGCPRIEGEFQNLHTKEIQSVSQSDGKIKFSGRPIEDILDKRSFSSGVVTVHTTCTPDSIEIERVHSTMDGSSSFKISIWVSGPAFYLITHDLSTGKETAQLWETL